MKSPRKKVRPIALKRTYWKSPRSVSPLSLVTSCEGAASPGAAVVFVAAWALAVYLARTAAAKGPPRSRRYSSWSPRATYRSHGRWSPSQIATTSDSSPNAMAMVHA